MFLIDTNDKLEKNIFRIILSRNYISNIYTKDNRIVFIWMMNFKNILSIIRNRYRVRWYIFIFLTDITKISNVLI